MCVGGGCMQVGSYAEHLAFKVFPYVKSKVIFSANLGEI